MILDGKIIANEIKSKLKTEISEMNLQKKFVAILFFGENSASKTYVEMKKKFGTDIGVNVEIFGQEEYIKSQNQQLLPYKQQKHTTLKEIINLIQFLNQNTDCIGIIVQLPLPDYLSINKPEILSNIDYKKDVDGLGGKLFGLASIDLIDFIPATPKSVIKLLEYYNYKDFKGKTITILGQSNLVGKPLALEFIKKGATVYSTNHYNDQSKIKEMCKLSDFVISCTGKVHLIDQDYVRHDKSQILIDVGYGFKDGKAVGDVNLESIKNLVHSYSPVPGGVGPLTVACLFDNIIELQKINLG